MENLERITKKTILVTGGTGFIGGHLVKKLVAANARVIVPYIEIDKWSTFALENLSSKVILQKVNINNKKKITELIYHNTVDYIIHLAAWTVVTESYLDPLETFKTNIMGTVHILEAARSTKSIKGIIVASSDKAYGKTKTAYSESSPLAGDHPYDVSKSSADLISQAYYKTYGTPVVITRFGNVYGEGDLHFNRIIPGICRAIIKNKKLIIRSDGTYVRDYLYVEDVVNGYIHLLNNIDQIQGEAYNFSSTDTLSVLALIEMVENITQKKIPYIMENTVKNEIPYQHLDDSKVRAIGWASKYTLKSSFKKVLDWYRRILK